MGQVVSGQQLGRTIGFPTANLQLPPEKFLPQNGVYAVEVQLGDLQTPVLERSLPAVMNLGYRPTVDGTRQVVEVHLLDWSGDLYDRTIVVDLKHFLRAEQKFDSLDGLKAQIQADCETARGLLAARESWRVMWRDRRDKGTLEQTEGHRAAGAATIMREQQ